MTAALPIERCNVAYLILAAAPRMSPWFRYVLAMSMVNPAATPDALFCLADALDEAAVSTDAVRETSILTAALYHHATGEFRALAELCRARGEQMAAAA